MEPTQPQHPARLDQDGSDQQGVLLPIPDPKESRRLLGAPGLTAEPSPNLPAGAATGAPAAGLNSAESAPGPAAPFRSGFVALIGRPNVGKSTLMNQLVGQKVAITSPVAQTTRNRLRAILTTSEAQLVLLDTPGIHKPHHLLGQRLVQSARGAIGEVDVVLLLVDGSQPAGRGDAFIVELLRRSGMPVMVALNKWDQVDPEQAEALIASYEALLATGEATMSAAAGSGGRASAAPASTRGAASGIAEPASAAAYTPEGSAGGGSAPAADAAELIAAGAPVGGTSPAARGPGAQPAGSPAAAGSGAGLSLPPDSAEAADQSDSPWQASRPAAPAWPLFPVSAFTGEGTEALVQALSAALPEGPHLYPPDAISDQPEQLLLAELIREQVLQHTREEVPHSVAVMIDRIVEDGPRTAVLATVLVERSSQKGILIGKGGSMLRTIGQGARLQMQKLISGPVYLELFVKVVPNWRSHPGRLSELGYRGD